MADDLSTRLQAAPLVVPGLFSSESCSPTSAQATRISALGWLGRQGFLIASVALLGSSLLWFAWFYSRAEPRASTPPAEPRTEPRVLPAPQPPLAPPPPVHFADGSTAQLHGATSAVFREEVSEERVRLRLVGGARFDVVPKRERSFIVANAQVVVRVIGTAFSIDPDGVRTRVTVERGRVQVMWRSGATILSAGEIALFPPENEPAFAPAGPLALGKEGPRRLHAKPKSKHRKSAKHAGGH